MTLPILARHRSVGSALWLYEYLREQTKPVGVDWMLVADGLCISDTQLGFRLNVAESTARRWRKRLEGLGYVYSELVARRHRRMWLANPNPPVRQEAHLFAPQSSLIN